MTKAELEAEALDNARNGASVANYPAIFEGFRAMGIAEADIKPRDNVLTFHAWKAVGRSVMKGQHGVKVVTFVPIKNDADEVTGRRAHTAVVFHVTQTELTAEAEARWAANKASGQGASSGARKGGYRRGAYKGGWRRDATRERDTYVRDPGEDAADRWTETHGR